MNPANLQTMLFDLGELQSLDQTRAESLVEPLLPYFAEAFYGAFTEFRLNVEESTRLKFDGRVRGQVVTRLAWAHVRDQLTEWGEVEFSNKLGFFKVIVDNEIVIRFKRLNADLLADSKDTDQSRAWFGNKHIDGINDDLLRLTFGYRPERNWMSCHNYYLTHQSSFKSLAWVSTVKVVDAHIAIEADDEKGRPAHGLPGIEIKPLLPRAVDLEEQA